DLACIYYRMTHWSPSKIIYFVDLRQKLHFEQAFEVAKSANWLQRKENNDTELIHAYNGSVSGKDGAFSSRKGNIIKLSDLLDEAESRAKDIILEKRDDIEGSELEELSKIIGIGAIKYGYLKKSRDTDVIFDWDEFMTFEGNSGPYIQYAYVRAKRILEKYGNNISKEITGQFETAQEVELVKILGTYQSVLIKTGDTNMPHHLCKYAFDVTKIFNSFYNSVHILNEEDENKKIIRLQLVELFTKNLKDVFGLLGIDMPEKM
ncbi:MAG: arginine--tRNA ligase, partial [Candidatus Gracilibacteria bacterium]|nr:arginine--tRNA ligase [Candidatus Gracilibacteria bacterium]